MTSANQIGWMEEEKECFLREFREKNMTTILENKQYPNADSSENVLFLCPPQSGVLSKKDLQRIAFFLVKEIAN